MTRVLRRFLFSRQYFAVLLLVLTLDMTVDIAETFSPGHYQVLNGVAIALDFIEVGLALWMFIDLSRRRKVNANDSRRG